MRFSYAGVSPYPTDPSDAATVVFPRPELRPVPAAPAPPAVVPAQEKRRDGGRRPAARGNAGAGPPAVLAAVVTGGLVASQIGATGLAGAAHGAPDTSLFAAGAESLSLRPAGSEAPLTEPSEAHPGASPAVLLATNAPDAALHQQDIEELHKADDLALRASSMHAAAAHEAYILRGGGNLDDWITVALRKLGMDQSNAPGVKRIILEESRGNPRAVNLWDSNAMAGRPSQGLMQVIPSTYFRYVLPELAGRPITDPVANITAGIRYMLANYGYLTLRQGGRYSRGAYVGY
ncbi:MAG TPA: transglycosylase SLT domain-containing protein [Pseudonocardia sp.]|jgi:hypothetical protein